MINRVVGLHFSPFGRTAMITERIAREIAAELDTAMADDVVCESYSLLDLITESPDFGSDSIVVIGVPAHVGKIPLPAARALDELDGGGALAITLVSYGTPSYGNSLYELHSYAEDNGFKVVGAGAFIVSHRKQAGRAFDPEIKYLEEMLDFCKAVSHKLERLSGSEVDGLRIKPAPLMIEGRMPVHKVSRFSPRAAEVAEHTFERASIVIKREPEWFL